MLCIRSSVVFTASLTLYTIVRRITTSLCLVDDRRTFLQHFVPCRRSSDVFTAVCALYTIVGRFFIRLCFVHDRRRFYGRLCLVDDHRSFLQPFVPRRRSSDVLTAVCALYTIVGRFLQPFVPCRRSSAVFTAVCSS